VTAQSNSELNYSKKKKKVAPYLRKSIRVELPYLGKIAAGIYGEVAKFQCCLKESDISTNDNSLLEKGTHKTFLIFISLTDHCHY
jgi:hypothetical protein